MAERALTRRQEIALRLLSRDWLTTRTAASMPSLERRGLVRGEGRGRWRRYELTDQGRTKVREIDSRDERAASASRGRALIEEHGGVTAALKATHPDHGGDPDQFADVQAAREAGVA